MKTKIYTILGSYNKSELGYMLKFKYDSYSENSKKTIDNYLIERNLNKDELLKLTHEKRIIVDNKVRCPRCSSDKFLVNSEQLWATSASGALNNYKTTKVVTCQVCGYNLQDKNHGKIKFFEKIFEFYLKLFSRYTH